MVLLLSLLSPLLSVVHRGMTQVLRPPDQGIHLPSQGLWAAKDLVQEDSNWYILQRLSHRDRPPRPCSRNREPVSVGCQKQNKETAAGAAVGGDSQTLTRKPLETVTLRRSSVDPRHLANGFTSHRSNPGPDSPLFSRQQSDELNSDDPVRQTRRRLIVNVRKRSGYRKRQINAANRELKALVISNERWNWAPAADDSGRNCRALSSEKPPSSFKEAGNPNDIATKSLKCDDSLSSDDSKEVIVPSWRVVENKRRYVIEQTEDLDDEVFRARHQKLELEEKRRKRWDAQRLRDLELLDRLHGRKDPPGNNSRTEPTSGAAYNDIQMTSVKVIEAEPVIAFGHFIACIPPREFSLPRFICGQSKSVKFKRPKSSKY